MKKLSLVLLSDTVTSRRKALKITQAELAERTGMNRSMLSKLESQEYTPSIPQLQALGEEAVELREERRPASDVELDGDAAALLRAVEVD